MNWQETLDLLEKGTVRSAVKENGKWVAQREVKEAILAAFKAGELKEFSDCGFTGFVDKHNLAPRKFTPEEKVRMVPGGSSVRRGAYVAAGVIIMPPAYINVGAYVDSGTMVDSHALVGSCAQIGKNVHLSAGVQIGGVLEPVGQTPVVIEDNAFIGAGAIIVEGVQVSEGAVIAPGVVLSKGIPVYDCINERILEPGEPIPPYAVVVTGSRPASPSLAWASGLGLQLRCALIIKYKDAKTSAALELETLLR
ncbi:MAG TPA: 2,3,4,5-tetrahydropyridine-2,6-dicarboxylate N-succinyltransferase [Bacteriovoracaceae bacterium]|nr:2,3,4,5-tetrahydropyridine-2,6-dicarboxylate N-succinyltransferase [Bacteriovoracaceae bacterium]